MSPSQSATSRPRLFLDENIPRPLRGSLEGFEVSTVEEEGWKGCSNGTLLARVEKRFDVFISSDSNLAYQNVRGRRRLSFLILPTNNLSHLRAATPALLKSIDDLVALGAPAMIVITWQGRRTLLELDGRALEPRLLAPVEPFAAT